MTLKPHTARRIGWLTAIFILFSLALSGMVQAEPLQRELAVAGELASQTTPTLVINSPSSGQPYTVGERAVVAWTFSGITAGTRLKVILKDAEGRIIRKRHVRAGRVYRFPIKAGLVSRLRRVTVCIPATASHRQICDARNVTILNGTPAPVVPGLAFQADSVGFSTLKDSDPPPQVVRLQTNGAAATFNVATAAKWLSVTPKKGEAPGSITLSVSTAGLTAGSYSTSVTATTGAGLTATLPVVLEVKNPAAGTPPVLTFSASQLNFSSVAGTSPPAQSVDLFSSDGGSGPFSLSSGASWLTLVPSVGGTPARISVVVSSVGLAPGTYTAEVAVAAGGYATARLPVKLTVEPRQTGTPVLTFSAGEVNFSTAGGHSPPPQSVTLSSSDGSAVSFSMSDTAPWLTVSPEGPGTPSRITLAANGSSMPPGSYTTAVTASANGYAPVTIPVRLAVGAPDTPALLADDFADRNADGWTIVNDVPSVLTDWRVSGTTNPVFRQFKLVGLDTRAQDQGHNTGTFAYWNPTLNLTDYRFDVTATPFSEMSLDIGVMFRYVDPQNYYRVSISGGNGFTRLERKLAGRFETLAVNARGFVRGAPQNISVAVQGSLIQVSLNGDRLFSARDDGLPTGGVAVYCRDNCGFDDASIHSLSAETSITVAQPVTHTVVTQSTFPVSAVVMNRPAGAVTVDFHLAGLPNACSTAAETAPGLFQAQCTLAADGRITDLTANLRQGGTILDADGSERVALGNQLIALGDSITFGLGDLDATDNEDSLGWTLSGGYTSVLTNLLNQSGGMPSMVFNNGIPGARSDQVLANLDPMLARHSEAQYALLLIGTNDAGRSVSVATYKSYMQAIIGKIRAAGKTPIVGLVPSRFDDPTGAMNARIAEYNGVIASQLGLAPAEIGPDFYNYFLNLSAADRTALISTDNLHPSGQGYRAMADLWNRSLGWIH